MSPDILIVRDIDCFRLLHGHLHLAVALELQTEVQIHVRGEGQLRVQQTRQGLFITKDDLRMPLLRN